ncbi:MAG: LamG domain-containing protein [Acidobacteriota bacterium]
MDKKLPLFAARSIHVVCLSLVPVWATTGCSSPPSASLEAPVILPSPPLERGYVPRGCGFDMNRNGIVGEPADCDVCDGETRDPDGDGVNEDLIYVDADEGSDRLGNGSPERPYQTIQYAWSSADGPGDGAEDIICFKGWATTEEGITPGVSGVPSTYTVPRSGSQARDWKLPLNPTMLVGWDTDNDGLYPPFDTDETAVLDGAGDGATKGLAQVFRLGPKNDYLEIAHLYISDYGRYSPGLDSGLLIYGPRGDGVDYTYYHDLEIHSMHKDRGTDVGKDFTINVFNSGLHWANFSNLLFADNGGWFVRGSGPDKAPDDGPMRWQNITRTVHDCDFTDCGQAAGWPGFKIWGYISRIEILDSIWDANVAHWEPNPHGGHGATVIAIGQCTQDWMIRNNEFIDPSIALRIQPASQGFCDDEDARPVDKVVFDRNIVRNTYGAWGFGNVGVDVARFAEGEGDFPGEVLGDLVITNNFLSTAKVGWESCIWTAVGNHVAPPPGRVVIANNTCAGQIRRWGAISVGGVDGAEDPAFMQQRYVVKNNIVTGLGEEQANIQAAYAPVDWVSDSNIFDDTGLFRWPGEGEADLDTWRQLTRGDGSSHECQPQFVDSTGGDFRLARTDNCAQGRGQNLSSLVGGDIDGDRRPEGETPWDVGADQLPARSSAEPPYRYAGAPADVLPAGSERATLGLATDEDSICRWSWDEEVAYSAMEETFALTGGRTHSADVTELVEGESYEFYVRCIDSLGNVNPEDYVIAFRVADLNTGLAGYWPFDDGAGITATDGSEHDGQGTLVYDPRWSSGRIGGALTFGGQKDYVSIDPSAGLDSVQNLTLATWVRASPTGRRQAVLDKRDAIDDGYGMYLDSSGRLQVILNHTELISSRRVADGRWHHVAAVYDGEDLALYIDGREDRWDWMNAGPVETLGELRVGGPWRDAAQNYLAGSVDDLRVYKRPLAGEEIARLAAGEK